MSLAGTNVIPQKAGFVVDIGCGVGQLLPTIAKKTSAAQTIGVDKSFLSLFLARTFFSPLETLLICADVNKDLPFRTASIGAIFSTDSFHYLNKRISFLKETLRVLTSTGLIAIFHIVVDTKAKDVNIKDITYSDLEDLSTRLGSIKIKIVPNTILWQSLYEGFSAKNTYIKNGEFVKSETYSIFVAKKLLPQNPYLTKSQYSQLQKSKLDYSGDVNLKFWLLLHKYIRSYSRVIFISAHLDDVVLSCGLLLEFLTAYHKEVSTITVFTQSAEQPYTAHVNTFIQTSGFSDAIKLFQARMIEDRNAQINFNTKCMYLNYVDAGFRKSYLYKFFSRIGWAHHLPVWLSYIYPNPQRQFSGQSSLQDSGLETKIYKELFDVIKRISNRQTLVVAPLGIGGHVDHTIIRDAANKLKKPVLYYEDFPYNSNRSLREDFFTRNWEYIKEFELRAYSTAKKYFAIRKYKSQMKVLFPEGNIPLIPERYYVRKDWSNL